MGAQLILTIVGPLKGLAYIVLLPLIGIFAIFLLGIRKLAALRLLLSKSPVATRDYDNQHQARL